MKLRRLLPSMTVLQGLFLTVSTAGYATGIFEILDYVSLFKDASAWQRFYVSCYGLGVPLIIGAVLSVLEELEYDYRK